MRVIQFTCLLLVCMMLTTQSSAQNNRNFKITGTIEGIADGTVITLASRGSDKFNTRLNGGKFSFSGKILQAGMPYALSIEGKEEVLEVFPESNRELILATKFSQWPFCDYSQSLNPDKCFEFYHDVRLPFGKAYADCVEQRKKFEAKKNNGATIIDSLQVLLAEQTYQTAIQNYIKKAAIWITMNPDSYYTPDLIRIWWPQKDRMNAYRRLTKKVRNGFFGKLLYNEIKLSK